MRIASLGRTPLVVGAIATACFREPVDAAVSTSATAGEASGTTAGLTSSGSTSTSEGTGGPTSSGGATAGATSTGSTGTTGDDPEATLTLLTLNLHCFKLDGTVYASNEGRFAAIAALAATREVDVMTVQEACSRPGESAIEALRAALEAATGAKWSSGWSPAHVAWEGTPDEAEEGVGWLARGEAGEWEAIDHAVQGSLRRVATVVTLPPELGGVQVMSVHFEVFEPEARAAQAREAATASLVRADPGFGAIVAGDFNDVEGSAAHQAFVDMGFIAADAGVDPSGIDHVMVHRAASWRPVSVEEVFVGEEAVSDHPGVLAVLEAATGDAVITTRVTALHDPGAGHFVALRGDLSPLTWTEGHPMWRRAVGEYGFVTTEIQASFEFKVLVDDVTWQTGENVAGMPGEDVMVVPVF